jgi:hypothetical protein
MNVLRYLLFATGAGLAAGALTILAWDLYEIFRLRKRASEAPLPLFNSGWRWPGGWQRFRSYRCSPGGASP